LAQDQPVVTDPGDQGEPAVAYDPTTQTYMTVFTTVTAPQHYGDQGYYLRRDIPRPSRHTTI